MRKPVKFATDPRTRKRVDGLRLHKPSGRYYFIDDDGKRAYLGRDLTAAADELKRRTTPQAIIPPTDHDAVLHLLQLGVPEQVIEDNDELVTETRSTMPVKVSNEWLEQNSDSILSRLFTNHERKQKGLEPLPLQPSESEPEPKSKRQLMKSGQDHPLSDCLAAWMEWERYLGRMDNDSYLRTVSGRFKKFLSIIGDKSLADVTHDDFISWQAWVLTERKRQNRTAKWHNDHHESVFRILKRARRKNPSWSWPEGFLDWAQSWDKQAYRPKKSNRKKISPTEFQKLQGLAEQMMSTSVDDIDKGSQKGRGQRRQAKEKPREGAQLLAMVNLMVNCGLDSIDVIRIRWEHIKDLDGDLPYMDFPRVKQESQIGAEVERLTPLLPATVEALRRLSQHRILPSGHIFYSQQGRSYSEAGIDKALARWLKAADVKGFTFKHIRNVGPSLAKAARRSKDERDAFLGHVVEGTSKFYEDDLDETYLIPLVNLIGTDYFGGQQLKAS